MKKKLNKGSAKRVIVIVALSLALLVALGAFSFAWIRNYVDVDNVEVTTGKMLYNFKLYRVKNGVVTPVTFFDTNNQKDAEGGNSEAKIEKDLGIESPLINVDSGEEIFFVIERYDDSIAFDVAISFDNDGRPENFNSIGQMNFALKDDSEAISGISSQAALEAYLKAPNANDAQTKNLGNIWNTVQKTSLSLDQKYALVRFKLSKNAGASAELEGAHFPFRIGLCVAQKDALPDDMNVDKFYVDDVTTLENAMQKYGFGDEIYITQSINYTGDLVFTRPCSITLIRSTLTLKGNLVFSYMYGDKFTLNTVSDGHIRIEKNKNSGGNFQIDLPNTTIEIAGANNDTAGKADIYVEGSFTANASKLEGEGLLFRGARICNIEVNEGVYNYTTDLKPILINGSSRISISNRTRLGKLSVNFYCRKFVLENNGYIEKLDLSAMTQDVTLLNSPAILIDNAGTLGTVTRGENDNPNVEDGDVILLPEWSIKFDKDDTSSASDNTHIIANKGSGKMLAITPNNSFNDSASIVNSGKLFYSRGDKEENGYRDDIDYMLRTQFVEAVGGDKSKVVIHYEAPAQIILNEDRYKDLAALNTLKSYIDYYAAKGDILAANELKEVTIICYGNKALTAPPLKQNSTSVYETGLEYDYNFIKSMTALTKLDLADAVSENKKVPDNAFKGMSTLNEIKMSESDTVWGKFLFTGTAVDEITFPQSLTTLDNHRNGVGNVDSQQSLDGIKYVYTSITVVDGFHLTPSSKQYLFTPDEYAYNEYRALYSNVYWYSKIFIDNGVRQFNDYFLRYDPNTTEPFPTCEFVVFTGGLNENGQLQKWVENEYNNCGFNFQRININGKFYTIESFDPYAFFDKLVCEESLEVVISSDVKYIGERAFACGPNMNTSIGLEKVTIEGNPEIMGNAFTYNDALTSFSAPELTSLKGGNNLSNNNVLKTVYMPKLSVVEGANDLAKCPKLERVDIGVIERTESNKNFYTSQDDYFFTRFFVHTEYANDVSAYNVALAADYRYIFVKESYAKLYKTTYTPNYTGVTEMGENPLSALIAADVYGNDLVAGNQHAYYYVIDGNEAHLVACLLSKINEAGNDYTTVSSFKHNGITYPVTRIGSAAYHFTYMIAQNITISDGVDEIGAYAFDSRKDAFKKYCITFNLGNVDKAGKSAFYYMDMARVVGEKLEEVGEDTFTSNQNLIVARLPLLSRSRPAGTTSTTYTVFKNCVSLRIAYTSISKDILFDGDETRKAGYVRFINVQNTDSLISIPNLNTVINSFSATPTSTFYRNHVNVNSDFDNIHLSDYYAYTVKLSGMTENIILPGYIYFEEEDGNLTLFAVSPDVVLYCDYGESGKDYTTPNELYLENGELTAIDNGTDSVFKVTKIGRYSYGAASFNGLDNFTIGSNIKEIGDYGLYGTAFITSNSTETMLKKVEHLNLANVEVLGKSACRDGMMYSLTANKLAILAEGAFSGCSNLKNVYLPEFVEATGTTVFNGCISLESATFGEHAKKFYNAMFQGSKNLKKITILNTVDVVTLNSTTAKLIANYEDQVYVYVPAIIHSAYVSAYKSTSGFGGISNEHFQKFGASSMVNGLTYYWNVLSEADKTAYIDYVEGTLPTTLNFPSEIGGYKVVSVSKDTIAALSGVTKIKLPDNMEYLEFDTSDLASTIREIEISTSNAKFKTANGVLYSKDGKILYIYPKAKLATAFTVESSVTEIAYRAFYNAKNIETLTIAGVVTVRDQAFESVGISTIKFTSSTASVFAGRDIFLGANTLLKISVPNASLGAFKSNVLIDYSILDKFIGA